MSKYFNLRILLAWILSLAPAYFALGFFGNFYSTFFAIAFLAILVQIVLGLFVYDLLGKAGRLYSSRLLDFIFMLALFAALTLFVVKMFGMAEQFPRLFDAGYFLLKNGQLIPFVAGSVLAFPCLALGINLVRQNDLKRTGLFQFMNEAAPGVLVAGFFFAVYFIFASVFNRPVFDVDDIFFDSDGLNWRTRFTTDAVRDYYWRSVHPFVLVIIRPLVSFVSFFLKGDKLAAAFVLVAFAGALCVFLTWLFVKRTVGNSLYAALIASLLGVSTAHLVFGSLLETYIFLAAVMMVFLVLLLKDTPLFVLIFTGLVSFGITTANFAQTAIAFLLVKRDIKQWIKYGMIAAALTIPLTLFNNFIYPNSQPYFFIPSSYTAETGNTFPLSASRAVAVGRVMFLHSVIAPDPLILKEEIPFLKVWMFKASPLRVSAYRTIFGKALVVVWLLLCLFGGFLFLKNLKKQDLRFPLAFISIVLFSFALHQRYGKDVFLYSTNWTYAIILFLALAWKEIADKKWFQLILLAFIALLMVNNSHLIFTMLNTAAMHLK